MSEGEGEGGRGEGGREGGEREKEGGSKGGREGGREEGREEASNINTLSFQAAISSLFSPPLTMVSGAGNSLH